MNTIFTLILSLLALGQAAARLEGNTDPFHRLLAKPFCGDNKCNGGETCATCAGDCACATGETCTNGACVSGSYCGDNTCDANEDCDSCPGDCGACFCGDWMCNGSDDCVTCPTDCGECVCGDGLCSGSEDCTSCPDDCGTCPNCADGQGCLCPDGSTTCSVDGDCSTEELASGTCTKGPNGGGACTSNTDCPQGQGFADCVGGGTVTVPGAFGDCAAPGSLGQFCEFTSDNTHDCGTGLHCGTPSFGEAPNAPLWTDISCSGHPAFPGLYSSGSDHACELRCAYSSADGGNYCRQAQCMQCAPSMTCEEYCLSDDIVGFWHNGAACDWYGTGERCDIYARIANTQSIDTGHVCDTHSWTGLGGSSCNDHPVTITGALVDGNCVCSATLGGLTKPVWDSRCIENYNGNGETTYLPCSFTG